MKKLRVLTVLLLSIILIGCSYSSTTTISDNDSQQQFSDVETYEQQFSDVSFLECKYILNKNTKIFHRYWCSVIPTMSERNKVYCNDTRENIITNGYYPCANCNP